DCARPAFHPSMIAGAASLAARSDRPAAMIRKILVLAVAALAACASRESPTPGETPLVVARVERVDGPASLAASPVFDALGSLGLALRALVGEGRPPTEAVLLTQTGETIQFALAPTTGRWPVAGDCVGVMPADSSAGLRAHYGPGEARLAPRSAEDTSELQPRDSRVCRLLLEKTNEHNVDQYRASS